MKNRWLVIFPMLLIPLLWLTHPYTTSGYIDDSDTINYGAYLGTVGFRLPIAALVNLFVYSGLRPADAALFLNSLAIFYLFYLLRKFDDLRGSPHSPWFYLAITLSSPLIILTKHNMSVDWYAGLLFAHFVLIGQELRKDVDLGNSVSWSRHVSLALLAVLSANIKETAWIAFFSYAVVFLFHEPTKYLREVGRFAAVLTLTWLVWRVLYASIYGQLFYDYWKIIAKPKGGSGAHEIAGTRASVPVPLFLFHIYNQLKIVGRCGIASMVVLLGLFSLRKRFMAQVYFVGIVIYTVIAVRGYLTSERYFAVFLPLQLFLFVRILDLLYANPRWQRAASVALLLAGCISGANYLFRYFPTLYYSAFQHL